MKFARPLRWLAPLLVLGLLSSACEKEGERERGQRSRSRFGDAAPSGDERVVQRVVDGVGSDRRARGPASTASSCSRPPTPSACAGRTPATGGRKPRIISGEIDLDEPRPDAGEQCTTAARHGRGTTRAACARSSPTARTSTSRPPAAACGRPPTAAHVDADVPSRSARSRAARSRWIPQHTTLYLGLGDPFDGTGIGIVKSTDGGDDLVGARVPRRLDASSRRSWSIRPTRRSSSPRRTRASIARPTAARRSRQIAIATGQTEAPYVWSIASTGGNSFVARARGAPQRHDGHDRRPDLDAAPITARRWTQATGITERQRRRPHHARVGAVEPHDRVRDGGGAELDGRRPISPTSSSRPNGGATWTALGAATHKKLHELEQRLVELGTLLNGQGWYNQLVVVDPTNPNVAYFGGALLLAKTSDGGTTLHARCRTGSAQFGLPYVHADFHAGAFDARRHLYVGTDGGIFKSTDSGTTFTDALNVGLVTHLLYSVGSSPADRERGHRRPAGQRHARARRHHQHVQPDHRRRRLRLRHQPRERAARCSAASTTTASTRAPTAAPTSSAPSTRHHRVQQLDARRRSSRASCRGRVDAPATSVYTFSNTQGLQDDELRGLVDARSARRSRRARSATSASRDQHEHRRRRRAAAAACSCRTTAAAAGRRSPPAPIADPGALPNGSSA